MYYIYGVSVPSPVIESTDPMITHTEINSLSYGVIYFVCN